MSAKYEGGYYLLDSPLIRTGLHTHTKALDNPVSSQTLDALNSVQRTPWQINDWLLDTMSEVYRSGSHMGGLPYADILEVPRKSEEEWEKMSEQERNDWKFTLSELHGANARLESRRIGFLSQLSIAQEMRDRPSIWFPHFLDFRTRFYPVPQGLHPQCDDAGKALLRFSEARRIGDRGLYWLAVRLANTYGMDKLHLDERVEWVKDHHREIVDAGTNPLDGHRFWAETDEEPWGFLATCREWALAHTLDDPTDFLSQLPVQLDGSCNGLQHLSAMGRDPIGAIATNVAANTERQDIYAQVAKVVERLVTEDAVRGDELAHEWVGRITRKVVKRAVMTTPYGVTERGIAEQLMSDGHTDGMGKRAKAATYLKNKIVLALDETVTSAKAIMAWLQEVASTLSDSGHPFRFTTPTGNLVQQSYYHLNRRLVHTLVGQVVLWDEDRTGGLQSRKQMLAAAPNLIHAFDASHLARTVNATAAFFNEPVSFSMIHDSFGTHPDRLDDLSRILRKEFVSIYQDNWLDRIEMEVRGYAPEVPIPSYRDFLTLGDFDVSEAERSEFFFA